MENGPTITSGDSPESAPGRNAFGMPVPPISELLKSHAVSDYVDQTLDGVLVHVGVPADEAIAVRRELLVWARNAKSLVEYEREGHRILNEAGVVQQLPEKLSGRAELIHAQIAQRIQGTDICDLGCGDGKVGQILSNRGLNVVLADVYKHPHVDRTRLSFHQFSQHERVPLPDNNFDTTLLLTVLHHADEPEALLREAIRITRPGGHLIVIESVFGVTPLEGHDESEKAFALLSSEEQRLANIFFDHLYNRLIHYNEDQSKKVNVPFNFNTPMNWNDILEQNGARVEELVHLGIDQPCVPEYHTLHVGRIAR